MSVKLRTPDEEKASSWIAPNPILSITVCRMYSDLGSLEGVFRKYTFKRCIFYLKVYSLFKKELTWKQFYRGKRNTTAFLCKLFSP